MSITWFCFVLISFDNIFTNYYDILNALLAAICYLISHAAIVNEYDENSFKIDSNKIWTSNCKDQPKSLIDQKVKLIEPIQGNFGIVSSNTYTQNHTHNNTQGLDQCYFSEKY